MKYCPQCNLEYEDETVFCSADGSRLQARVPRAAPRQMGGLGGGAPLGSLGGSVLSSQPISPLGSMALSSPTPPRGMPTGPRNSQPDDASETVRPPARSAPTAGGLALEMKRDVPEPIRQPAISTEMRMPVTSPSEPPEGDMMLDMPTIAMKTPLSPQQAGLDEDGQRNLIGGMVAGRYKVLRRLGEGGMGVVYEAVDERLEKHVAVKVLRDDFAKRQDVVARFTQEAKSAARIKHENVLDVTDYGQTEDGSFYIAMELLTGTDLADVLQADGVVSQERGIEVAIQVCRALQAAHQKGIVHRDLKPENIFLVKIDEGRELVKIVDFGIAQMKDISGSTDGSRKLTRTGMIFGTPEYMSPEQAAGKPVDHRVDVYAAGVILYEMFTGRVPFMGDTFMGILTKHMFESPPPLKQVNPAITVPPDLEAVIFKALAKDPAQRYASMQEFADDLGRFRSGGRTNAAFTPPSAPVVPAMAAQVLGMNSAQGGPSYNPGYQPPPEPTVSVGRTVESEFVVPPRRPVALIVIAVVVCLLIVAAIVAELILRSEPAHVDPPATPTNTTRSSLQTPVQPVVPSANPNPQNPVAAPLVPAAHADAGAAVAQLLAPPILHVRIVADGFPSHTAVTLQYADGTPGRAPIAPCDDADDCQRQVLAGVRLRVTASRRSTVGETVITPTRDQQEIHVSPARPAAPRVPDPNATNAHAAHGEVPCGQLDPHTGLIRICFDHH